MSNQKLPKVHIITVLAAVLLAGILIALVVLLLQLSRPVPEELSEYLTPEITTNPAPTETAIISLPTSLPVETEIAEPVLPPGTIGIGSYVKVSGTEGAGLRIRIEPGTSTEVMFVAMDEEVFRIIGGPIEKDGYLWWQLEAPYDKTRAGWSANPYITLLETEEP